MTPDSPTTVSNPKYLTDLDVSYSLTGQPIPDDALLCGPVRERPPTWIQDGPIGSEGEEGARRRLYAVEAGRPGAREMESSTIEIIPTDDLAAWVRRSVPQLLRLCELGDDWDSYGSPPPSLVLVKRIVEWLKYTEIEDLLEPEIVPACGGGVQLEWYVGDRELELEFMADGRIECLATDNRTGQDVEERLGQVDDLRLRVAWVVERA